MRCCFIVQILLFTKNQTKTFNPVPFLVTFVLVQIIHLFGSTLFPLILCFSRQIKQLTTITALLKTNKQDTKNQIKTISS